MTLEFESYNDYYDWCEEHRYDPEKEMDKEEEPDGRYTIRTFYLECPISGTFAQVAAVVSYDGDWRSVYVTEGLVQKKVMVTKNVYEVIK